MEYIRLALICGEERMDSGKKHGNTYNRPALIGGDERMDSGKYQWNIIDLLSLVEMRGWIQVNYLTAYDFRHKPKVHRPNFLILTLSVPDIHFFKSIAHF